MFAALRSVWSTLILLVIALYVFGLVFKMRLGDPRSPRFLPEYRRARSLVGWACSVLDLRREDTLLLLFVVCLCVYACVCVCVRCMYVYIYIYINRYIIQIYFL